MSKIVKKIRIWANFLDTQNNVLYPIQFGICKQHSTKTAVCYFIEQIQSKLDKVGVVGAVFLDLQKAFDALNHNILLYNLSFFNFLEDTIKWIESHPTSRKPNPNPNHTQINTHISSLGDCSTGVPQGSTLGPLLFSLYLNDFPDVCPDVHIQMFADDTVIYVHDKTVEHVALKNIHFND